VRFLIIFAVLSDCLHVLPHNVLLHRAGEDGADAAVAGMVLDSIYHNAGLRKDTRNNILRAGGHYVSRPLSPHTSIIGV